jgi:pimeloyl-ACP methyl ester carboxylesterase
MMLRNLFIALLVTVSVATASAAPQWLSLPPTPTLPKAAQSGLAPVNGVKVWYAVYGRGEPVILLHGGLANANYWGHQVRALQRHYQVIVMESRGHGRSSRNQEPYGYDLMASDVVALFDHLKIKKAAIVGWSDGAIIGLDLAIRHPERVTRVFAFGANTLTSGVKDDVEKNPTFAAFVARAGREYARLSPTPRQYTAFHDQIAKMWETEPNWTDAQLRAIATPIWVVDGEHDEAIKREHTEYIAATIPGARLLILPNVSHFAFLQDPAAFNDAILRFLGEQPPPASPQQRERP